MLMYYYYYFYRQRFGNNNVCHLNVSNIIHKYKNSLTYETFTIQKSVVTIVIFTSQETNTTGNVLF